MANIKEKSNNKGELVFYFSCFLGRSKEGTQIRKYKTWHPPKELTLARARKMAEVEASAWEEAIKKGQSCPAAFSEAQDNTEEKDDFAFFVEKMWFPLQVKGQGRKPKTIAFWNCQEMCSRRIP